MKALGKGSIASIVKVGLDVVWVLFWAGAALIGVAAIVYAIVGGLAAANMMPQGVQNALSTQGRAAPQLAVPALLGAILAAGGGLIIIGRLKKLFANFTSGEPFQKDNANHLRAIWIAMVVVELGRYAILGLAGVMVTALGEPRGQDFSFSFNINLMTWAAILVLIVLAEVFREGARLRQEQDLTI
jgi:thiamine transporter ThiT